MVPLFHSTVWNGLQKQTNTFEDQVRKPIDALNVLKSDTQQLTIKDAIPEDQTNKSQKLNWQN